MMESHDRSHDPGSQLASEELFLDTRCPKVEGPWESIRMG